MNDKHLQTLEFPRIRSRLAEHTTFSAGRALALGLRPSPIFVEVNLVFLAAVPAGYLVFHGYSPFNST